MTVLDPNSRRTYLEMLKPPSGYRFDCGVGTTYSVDLLAAMMVPLSLALLDADGTDATQSPEPIALLEAMRRFSQRIVLFHEPDRAISGRAPSRLTPLLDSMLIPALTPNPNGIFHPKVWALRFAPTPFSAADGAQVIYRLLVMSRNLTFDRSWDVALQIDGQLLDRQLNIGRNRPLKDFFSALPGMANIKHPPSPGQTQVIDTITSEIGRVKFNVPDPFENDSLTFIPLGLGNRREWPFAKGSDRLLIVSPFLQSPTLKALLDTTENLQLISTIDSLEGTSPDVRREIDSFNIAPSIIQNEDEPEHAEKAIPTWDVHAKIYLSEKGRQTTLMVGSANATEAAFGANVEFLVGLGAKKKDLSVDSFLEPMNRIIEPFAQDRKREISEDEALKEKLKEDLEAIRRTISRLQWAAVISAIDDGRFNLNVNIPEIPEIKFNCRLSLHLLARKDDKGAAVNSKGTHAQTITFSDCRLEELSTLWQMSLRVSALGTEITETWVQMIPANIPADRDEAIVRSLVSSKTSFQKYLYFLLADPEINAAELAHILKSRTDRTGKNNPVDRAFAMPLFEQLLIALSDDPTKLDRIHALVNAVSGNNECEVFPEGFKPVWDSLWKARNGR